MPSFEDKLSDEQISDVADFVATWPARAGSRIHVQARRQEARGLLRATRSASSRRSATSPTRRGRGPRSTKLDELQKTDPASGQLPPDRAHDRRRRPPPLRRKRRQGVRRRAAAPAAPATTTGSSVEARRRRGGRGGEVAREACNDPEIKANGFNYYQCDHGLGHGLMLYTAYDLPQALGFCHKLATNSTRSPAAAASSWRT